MTVRDFINKLTKEFNKRIINDHLTKNEVKLEFERSIAKVLLNNLKDTK
jgi:hypothetical protein